MWLRELNIVDVWRFAGLAFFVCVPHAAFEEYYWRWFVFGWMRRYLAFWPAAIVAGLAFMAHHVVILVVFFPDQVWTLAVPLSLCVAVGGIVWAWFYERTGSLGAVWLCHGLIDLGIMLVGWHMAWCTWWIVAHKPRMAPWPRRDPDSPPLGIGGVCRGSARANLFFSLAGLGLSSLWAYFFSSCSNGSDRPSNASGARGTSSRFSARLARADSTALARFQLILEPLDPRRYVETDAARLLCERLQLVSPGGHGASRSRNFFAFLLLAR